ncbi:putative NADH-dependent flavin oxidoreductase YqiG [Colletotrichum siamense]|uniref:putative NADH-dependent flavin oxidoreductase YqiG n=1 Tax=Colletotrichum siamense TaxID=690259 RepID=UPI001872D417|nr:putative NADH-dependent flavin oxidoreductase YqiG [Colletotrichum siamense]KAF5506264.1 putative NADH-dependent flavin oxidoreductase YqiG [Colletotrichum siamense]
MRPQDLFSPLSFKRGPPVKSRILLAPLTNWQCHPDGTVSEDEVNWLERCAAGGFSMVMTCAANIHPYGKAFPGQMGIYSDHHLEGLRRIADVIRKHGALSSVQLHHAGLRANPEFVNDIVGPSDIPDSGVRGLSLKEVEAVRDDFIAVAQRAEAAGFDGVEVHSAFGWIPMQFLSPLFNHRTDKYGGSLENRSRFLFEVIRGIRQNCKPDFQIGLRVSLERYGVPLTEMYEVLAKAIREEEIDYLDLAVWDWKKVTQEAPLQGKTFLSIFMNLPRSSVRIGATGKIMDLQEAITVLEGGCDFVMFGRAAILEHDFPKRLEENSEHQSPSLPVSEAYLKAQGLSDSFVKYMKTWEGFVAEDRS